MAKLHELVAVMKGRVGEAQRTLSEIYKTVQKSDLFDGLNRTYRPAIEDGEKQPSEEKRPQADLRELIRKAAEVWGELFDLSLTIDSGNQHAKAGIKPADQVEEIIKDVPVATLLFMESKLNDIRTFIEACPVPDPAERWTVNTEQNLLSTLPVETARTKKLPVAFEKAPATDRHPAQVEVFHEDRIVGYWQTIKHSTKISAVDKAGMLERVSRLLEAVKMARERANDIAASRRKGGEALMEYVFGGILK